MSTKTYTFTVSTKGSYEKVEDLCSISFTDDSLYAIQILGDAKLVYSDSTPGNEGFTICFPQPFSYKKLSGEDLYLKTGNNSVTMTIAGE